jgi:hypothetical protein
MLEHIAAHALYGLYAEEAAQQSRKLVEVVPSVKRLLSEPESTLDRGAIIIPSSSSDMTALLFGGFLSACVGGTTFVCTILWLRRLPMGQPNPPNFESLASYVIAVPTCLTLICTFFGVRWLRRGGQIVLNRQGVEFKYRGEIVTCPWSLFRADGIPDGNYGCVIVPIAREFLDRVELLRETSTIAVGREVQHYPFQFCSESQVKLQNVYGADLRDIASLLLFLGKKLG